MIDRLVARLGERNFGFIGMIGVVLAGVVVAVVSFVPFGQSSYVAELRHTAGLQVGEEVQIAGISVGEVRNISLDGQKVRVDFSVDKDAHLGRSTTATVKIGTLLGNHYLEVAPAGGGSLANNMIDLKHTAVSYNLQDVIEGSSDTLEHLDGKTIEKSLSAVADALDYSPEQSREAIDGIARLSKVAAAQSDKLHALLASSAEVTDLMADNSKELINLMRRSTGVLEELTKRRKVIHAMLADSRELAQQITGVLADNKAELDPMMRDFASATHNLRLHEAQLTDAIDAIATLSHYLANASGSGKYLDLHAVSAVPDSLAAQVGGQ